MVYNSRTGVLYSEAGHVLGQGGSGFGLNWNNPSGNDWPNVDPIPAGCIFDILAPINVSSIDPQYAHLGSFAIPLKLAEGPTKRSGFYIHGYTASDLASIAALPKEPTPTQIAAAHTSSHGCIEMPFSVRQQVEALRQQGDIQLSVI